MRRGTKRIVDGRRDRKPKREVGQRCEWWGGQQASGGGNERMRRTKRFKPKKTNNKEGR